MHKLPLATPARLLGAILAICLTATAQQARNPSASPTAPGLSKPAASPTPNDEMLARAAKLYYSSAKTGFESFDCALHPDWHTLFVSASKGSEVAEDDPRIVLLKSVGVTMHGKLKGGSAIDWNPATNADKPLDQDSTTLLNNMHTATEQTLQGFMQFWTPFVDGSAVPNNSAGLEITKTELGYTLHADTKDTKVTEQMDKQLTLTHFDVVMSQATVHFEPSYKSTDKGLLVNGFMAHIFAAGAPPEPEQEMHVAIEYQNVQGFPIPSQLNMSVVGTGIFNFALDGCIANAQPK
ncbi:MAG TPA: hypothetical protein VFC37_18710 [Terracidiphilus sp.]|jgi:hypothetical protein|nr:hypothetical protein [Terracidiphilus sp.]